MIIPKTVEELNNLKNDGQVVLFFTATWCVILLNRKCQKLKQIFPNINLFK